MLPWDQELSQTGNCIRYTQIPSGGHAVNSLEMVKRCLIRLNNQMKELKIAFNKSFRLWDYVVSHDRMLLRSPKTDNQSKNTDIILTGVEFINIPTMFDVISMKLLSIDKIEEKIPKKILENSFGQIVILIEAKQGNYWILCTDYDVMENDLELMETSLKYDLTL